MPLPTDPLLGSQWHLGNSNPSLLDLNVRSVWNPTQGTAYTGAGVRAVVIDDGFDYLHADLAPNYRTDLDFDFDDSPDDTDPFGVASNSHGTAVMGIIGADNNGTGAVGVAFDTELIGYRGRTDVAAAITRAATVANADLANISLGYGVDQIFNDFLDTFRTALTTAVTSGRGGLGMSVIVSAGNDRVIGIGADTNGDDWKSDTHQIVVAAVNQDGNVSSYSTPGASILVSAFGTPLAGEVVTTDRRGSAGYNGTDFTSGFNGTSAAAPMVSGVVSLMYDANAGLGWRDVQHILANSARHVGSAVDAVATGSEQGTTSTGASWFWNNADTWNGGGLHFSNDYGYGLVDAHAAVRLAETWHLGGVPAQTVANEFRNTMDMVNVATTIPDGNAAGVTFTGLATFADEVERVEVRMNFSTTWLADVEVYVTSPNGTVSRLIADRGSDQDFNGTWTFGSQAFHGERANGTWSVRVVDDAGGDVLQVTDLVLTTFGRFSTDDRYVFTDEYSDYDGIAGHATFIGDANGGNDTINAAAVTTGSIIRLDGPFVTSVIDGVSVAINGTIENAIGGDGGDTIVGNAGANILHGMRGNDVLNGAGGADRLFAGDGDDYVYYDAGDVLAEVLGGSGFDTLIVQAGTSATGFNLAAHEFERGRIDWVDTAGQAWSTVNQYFQPGWTLDYNDTFYDNGTRQVQVFDTGAPDSWSSYIDYYNAGGQLTGRRTINDNGTYSTTFFDLAGQSWKSYTDYNYGPQNQLTARQTINDNNSYSNTFFDALNQNTWSQYTDHFNAAGTFLGRTGVWDDGTLF